MQRARLAGLPFFTGPGAFGHALFVLTDGAVIYSTGPGDAR
jgi:hypothetical protein